MKTTISKESDKTYLILEDMPVHTGSYSLKMAETCPVEGLLPCSLSFFNGENRLRYLITGLTSLSARFSDISIHLGDIRNILYTLRDVCVRLPDYLLDEEDLLLDPDDIFISPGSGKVGICYVPGLQEELPESRKLLAEFILKHTDHKDEAASQLAYSFYDKVTDDSCVMASLLPSLLRGPAPFPASGSPPFPASGPAPFPASGPAPFPASGPSPFPASGPSGHDVSRNFGRGGPNSFVPPESDLYRARSARPQSGNDDFSAFEDSPAFEQGAAGDVPHPALPRAVKRRKKHDRNVILLLIFLAAAASACAVFLLNLDATQAGGIGFLSVSVIWLVRQHQYKKSGDLQNIWSDEEEEMTDDDTFYRSLLKEVYAQDAPPCPDPAPSPGPSSPASLSGFSGYDGNAASFTGHYGHDHRPDKAAPFTGTSGHGPETGPCLVSLQPRMYNDIPLRKDIMLIGKNARECDICLKSDTVSRVHAKIVKIAGDYYLTDLFSTNGTWLDGRRLEPNHPVPVPEGAEVTFAEYHYRMQA